MKSKKPTTGKKDSPNKPNTSKAAKPKIINLPAPIEPETEHERTAKAKTRVLKALEQALGIVTTACRMAECSRTQFYEWMKTDDDFKTQVEAMQDVALDFAESQLFQQIKKNNAASTIFYLKTKGKKRGYIERTETKHDFGDDAPEFEISIRRNRPEKNED